ncbi:MAG: hypothetical protein KGN01_08105 [Patescibacteria group bacterium]|nr:hypothetical protein [Patescibacteria group bacterium]
MDCNERVSEPITLYGRDEAVAHSNSAGHGPEPIISMAQWNQADSVKGMVERGDVFTFYFNGRKYFLVEGEEITTDEYGQLEVSPDSFLVGYAGVVSTDNEKEATRKIRDFLLKHEIEARSGDSNP